MEIPPTLRPNARRSVGFPTNGVVFWMIDSCSLSVPDWGPWPPGHQPSPRSFGATPGLRSRSRLASAPLPADDTGRDLVAATIVKHKLVPHRISRALRTKRARLSSQSQLSSNRVSAHAVTEIEHSRPKDSRPNFERGGERSQNFSLCVLRQKRPTCRSLQASVRAAGHGSAFTNGALGPVLMQWLLVWQRALRWRAAESANGTPRKAEQASRGIRRPEE